MVVSTGSSYSLEEIASVATGPLWFQLYIYRDLSVTVKLLQRAKAAGYQAIVLTVDSPLVGRRERDLRNNFCLPSHVQMANFADEAWKGGLRGERAPITWETLHWLQSETSLPLILKGILTAEDAHMAVEHGVAGIIVSNHGGRQLDSAVTSIEALPEIVEAVADRCEVYIDGGIRRGTDILKALGLGAHAVLIGRPILWGLAANGAEGVCHVLHLLRKELELDMALAGHRTLASIDRNIIKMAP
jgi:4-hydroxymandelate oxidase